MNLPDIIHPVQGLHALDALALIDRLALGSFFAISGWHKAFHPARRAALAETFKDDGCYSPAMMCVVPTAELLGGLAILVGFLTPIAAAGLMVLCGGATFLDGLKRVRAWAPLDRADFADDVLYLPEVLYLIMLLGLVLVGPGRFSLDAYIWTLFR